MMMMKKGLFAAACVLALCGSAMADALLVDRGLPTDNLNNAAGANRSNVAWVDGGQTAAAPSPSNYWVEGDTFKNTGSTGWAISTIRVWTVGPVSSVSLLGGLTAAGAAGLSTVSTGYAATTTSYAGGVQYQSSSGAFTNALTEIDFAVNLVLGAGEQFSFFLDGTGGNYVVPFMSAANAALAGSPQDGADDLIWEANLVGGSALSVDSFTTLNNGWDKASDFNVQVFGAELPEPGSIALVGVGLLGALVARRRKS